LLLKARDVSDILIHGQSAFSVAVVALKRSDDIAGK